MSFKVKEFNRLAGKAVFRFRMIEEGDRILVGVSGGKDSLALITYLAHRRQRVPIPHHLEAVYLDMGYGNPDEERRMAAYIRDLGVDYHFETTDYAIQAHSEINRENPCFLCARLRRRRLFELAKTRECGKIALGHHRDDLNETLLLNIFYSGEISTMRPSTEFFGGLLTVIRPLCMVPEELIRKASRVWALPVSQNRCPSSNRSKRNDVKEIVDRLAAGNRKIRGNIFRSLSNWKTDYLLPPQNPKSPSQGRPSTAWVQGEKEPGTMEQDQRKRRRVAFDATVNLTAPTQVFTGLTSRDLSLKGIFVLTDNLLPIDTPVDIQLELTGQTSRIFLSMKGRVVRSTEEGMAIDFLEIDIDSFFHLRNIVRYNTDDPGAVDDELASKPAF